MVYIPGGTFKMGSPKDEAGRWKAESPDFSRDLRERRMVLEGHPRTIVSLFSISRSLVS